MGQKTHPKGFRLGVIETWDSRWFAKRDYSALLHEDIRLRNFIKKRLYHAGISKVEIERAANKAKINIYTARPGIVIGKKGAEIEKLKQELTRMTGKEPYINIHEVRRPDLDAQLVAESVANFELWWDSLDVVPVISALRERADAIRRAEIERTLSRLGDLSDADRKRIVAMTEAIVKKMLDRPIARLKDGADKGLYMEALEDLFDLHPSRSRGSHP